jgi:hypothetical protein
MRIGRRKVIRDSIRRGLNPQDLRTMGKVIRRGISTKFLISKWK